jgi:hypothetical protein
MIDRTLMVVTDLPLETDPKIISKARPFTVYRLSDHALALWDEKTQQHILCTRRSLSDARALLASARLDPWLM